MVGWGRRRSRRLQRVDCRAVEPLDGGSRERMPLCLLTASGEAVTTVERVCPCRRHRRRCRQDQLYAVGMTMMVSLLQRSCACHLTHRAEQASEGSH